MSTQSSLPPIPDFNMMSEEQMTQAAKARYDRAAPFMISNWPAEVLALSFPTTMVEITHEDMREIYSEDWKEAATRVASKLDEVMDWNPYFIRMDSRSPKDSSDNLVTCSGRQALMWIMTSERCLDDSVTAARAGKPIYICLRKPKFLHKDAEFRCFAKDGKVLAVSRYFYKEEAQYRPDKGDMMKLATAFYEKHLAKHYNDVVFDLYCVGGVKEILIELNPYGLSDPCMFKSYEEIENEGGERI